ncbi:beta-carotene 15,15'-dioxygenase, Brp/Blh family [Deinococcus sp. QL22]|uniref:beta-carotene 15,15'-dioxygenase, Brp/Blh family n=1 Tax=Deinococcus sp. QL22 TaxID=2939437 RepID=UPI0020171334|nr:beta-carotene 15,15'-dioxygenase, Brp/Blh family [Deinococcus sp. QL22]UQN10048.1 Brp/Blh family beta-carotene 15,15'-dioxygenase [Deinococcus sp. QL22]
MKWTSDRAAVKLWLRPVGAAPLPLTLIPWSSMALLLVLWLLFPQSLTRLMYLPLLVSTVLLGIPHGALDHLVPTRIGWRWGQRLGVVVVYIAVYALLAALALGLWWLLPCAAFWGFVLLSCLHWGHGDLHYLETVQGRRRWLGRWSAAVTLLARGSLPILVPLLAFPEWFGRLASGVGQAFGQGEIIKTASGPLLSAPVFNALAVVVGVILLGYVADTLRSSRVLLTELAETALLLLTFLLVPAPLSIGIYFTLWHAWRHLGRLLKLQPVAARPVLRLSRDLLPISLIALALLGGLYLWAAPQVHNLETFAALYLALIAALTLPHALLVAVMDLKPGSA